MFQSRYRRILWFFGRVILNFIGWEIILARLGLRGLVRRTRSARYTKIARNFRALAVQMGGVMIKMGQFLSSRLDVLPREITDELAGLQDEVRPETFADIRKVAEAEFGCALEERYTEFDPVPLASASIGQVHLARLIPVGGERTHAEPVEAAEQVEATEQVVVKIQRPHIEDIIAVDLSALRVVSGWINRYKPIARRANIPSILEEFSRSLLEEVDYLHEGKNAEVFAKNFADRPDVCVPNVVWSHTTRRALTLEYIRAIKITDYAAIEAAGIQRSEVASRLFDVYLKQIFDDHFFHADPHPGNLFVLPQGAPGEWVLVFVDFGMTGQILPNIVAGLREGIIAVATRDPARIIKAYQVMNILLPGADLEMISRANQRVFDRFWGKTAPEMMEMHTQEAMAFVKEFSDLLYELPFQVPENIILLGRCMGILSGICTGLDADFNIWTGVVPYGDKLLKEEGGSTFTVILKEAGALLQTLIALPRKTEALLARAEQGKLEVQTPQLQARVAKLEAGVNRLAGAIISAALILAATQLYLAGQVELAAGAGGLALLSLVWVLSRR